MTQPPVGTDVGAEREDDRMGARWSPRSRNYSPGDGSLPETISVHVWARGPDGELMRDAAGDAVWLPGRVTYQQWSTQPGGVPGREPGEVFDDWVCSVRRGGFSEYVPAGDLDWGVPDPALEWLAALCGVDQVKEAVTW